jgi:hypothetical protein
VDGLDTGAEGLRTPFLEEVPGVFFLSIRFTLSSLIDLEWWEAPPLFRKFGGTPLPLAAALVVEAVVAEVVWY